MMTVLSQSNLTSTEILTGFKKGMMNTQKTLTQTQFSRLDNALNEAVVIDRIERDLAKRKEENRAKLLELGTLLVNSEDRTAAPGFQVSQDIEVKFDEPAALIYAMRDDVFAGAFELLGLRKDAVGVLIGMCLRVEALHQTNPEIAALFPDLRRLFIVDKTGYARAVRETLYSDIPFMEKVSRQTVRITAKAVKVGDDLAKEFVITEDLAPETAIEQISTS